MAYRVKTFVKGVRGKVIKKIETGNEEDQVYIDIHFDGKTSCIIYIGPAEMKVESAQGDWLERRR